MDQRRIGTRSVSAIGLGAMPMSVREVNDEGGRSPRSTRALDARGHPHRHRRRLLHRRGDVRPQRGADRPGAAGVRRGHLGRARRHQGRAHPARDRAGSSTAGPTTSARPASPRSARLGVEQIALYQHHRPDPAVPYDETIGGLKPLLDEGLIAAAGISNADPDQIRLATDDPRRRPGRGAEPVLARLPQLASRRSTLCAELGLAFLAWSPLGGMSDAAAAGRPVGDVRRGGPQARREPPAGVPGLGAVAVRRGHPDPRRQPPGVGRATRSRAVTWCSTTRTSRRSR